MKLTAQELRETYPNISEDVLSLNTWIEQGAVVDVQPIKRAKPTKETEEHFQKRVIDLAHRNGWKVAHFRGAWSKDGKSYRTPVGADGKGFPDLVMVRAGRIIFVELKAQRGTPSYEQAVWLQELGGAMWKPSDWKLIEGVLR